MPVYPSLGEARGEIADIAMIKGIIPVGLRATVCEYPAPGLSGGRTALRPNSLMFVMLRQGLEGVSYATSLTGLNAVLMSTFVPGSIRTTTKGKTLVYDPEVSSALVSGETRIAAAEGRRAGAAALENAERDWVDASSLDPSKFGVVYECPEDVINTWNVVGTFRSEQKVGNTGPMDLALMRSVMSAARGARSVSYFALGRTMLLHYTQGPIHNGQFLALQVGWFKVRHNGERGHALQVRPFVYDKANIADLRNQCSGVNPRTGIPEPMYTIELGYVVDDYFDAPVRNENMLTDPEALGAETIQLEMNIRVVPSVV